MSRVTEAQVEAFQHKYREIAERCRWGHSWPSRETSRELIEAALSEPEGSEAAAECMWTDKPCTCGGGHCEQVSFGADNPASDNSAVTEADVERVARAICKSKTCEGFLCCQNPAQMGRTTNCPVKRGGYDDAARAAIAALASEIRTLARVGQRNEVCAQGIRISQLEGEARALLDELARAVEAMTDIATSDDINNALDPARNKRVAAAFLADRFRQKGPRC
ncbi:hypothetical protein [Mesorhizobium sp. INR15]|uniref:hypothetical protein n=1 Tax=Mesorhizobium sp. INR15 TaxID=2654248 RepID=UPI00189696E9|nr:hypothetical protein [Mesorhizobium sp. INR15]QPC91473.1 hypothetical protein GA829_13110 [Mesorhizobium sp. INR15]